MDDLLLSKDLIDHMLARTIEAENECIKHVTELKTLAHELAHATARRLVITQTCSRRDRINHLRRRDYWLE